jgi:hypothetical protein
MPLAVDEPTETDVKKCVSCAKDLPDTALHCVFCGSKQPAAAPPGGAEPPAANPAVAKTMMGYQAADLLKNLPKPPGGQSPAAPQPAPPSPLMQPPAMQPPQQSPMQPPAGSGGFGAQGPQSSNAAMAKTAFAAPPIQPPSQSPMQPPQPQSFQPPQQQPYQPPQPMQPPGGGFGAPPPGAQPPTPAAQAATMFMEGPRPGAPGSPQPLGGPSPMHGGSSPNYPPAPGPSAYPPPPAPMGQPMHGGSSANYPPAPGPSAYPPPPAYAPPGGPGGTAIVPAPTPPYLASQTAARMRPTDPFANGLSLVLIVFGVLLLAAFVTPLAMERETVFWWDGLEEMPGKMKVMPILLAGAGLLGVLLGAIPLSSTGRGAVAAALGVVGILYPALALPAELQWQGLSTALGTILVPTGLLLRSAYRDASLGRILATVGAIAVIVPFLVPVHDKMPVQGYLDMLSSDAKEVVKVAAAMQLARLAIAALALLAWIPAPSEGGAKAIAWIWIVVAIVAQLAILLAAGDIADGVQESPNLALLAGLEPMSLARGAGGGGKDAMLGALATPSGVVASAYIAFAGYGLATLLGKNLER